MRALLPALLVFSACSSEPTVSPTPLTRETRRSVLEDALWQPQLPYARKLLSAYGLDGQGWELLPLMSERSAVFRVAHGEALAAGATLPIDDLRSVREADSNLGRAVFHRLPMRADRWLDWLAANPQHWDAVGLRADDEGNVHGLVRYVDELGEPRVGATCALCHSAPSGGLGNHDGFADRGLDLGLARSLWRQAFGLTPGRGAVWGPGRIDVTDDGVDSPTVVPDLFGLEHARYLNCSGVIEVTDPSVPAVRFETQYILGHELLARPARDLMVSLADYIYSLSAGTQPSAPPEAFIEHCSECHDPAAGYAGGLIDAVLIGTDLAAAETPERGTGYYKVPSLLGVSLGGPYFHDGSAASLDDLLDVHPPLSTPTEAERADISEFLTTL